jgi:hypothetical protein
LDVQVHVDVGHSTGDGGAALICLNDLPPERKEKAKAHLENTWPKLLDELAQVRKTFGNCKVYYEVIKDGED